MEEKKSGASNTSRGGEEEVKAETFVPVVLSKFLNCIKAERKKGRKIEPSFSPLRRARMRGKEKGVDHANFPLRKKGKKGHLAFHSGRRRRRAIKYCGDAFLSFVGKKGGGGTQFSGEL